MGRITWFLLGNFVGAACILNHVYETELLKEEIK
jgi:hypothetical protein